MKYLISIILIFFLGANMPKKLPKNQSIKTLNTLRIKWNKGIKKGKFTIPADIQFCYPNYRELQKGKTLKQMMEIAKNRKSKVNPFFYKPKIKKGNT